VNGPDRAPLTRGQLWHLDFLDALGLLPSRRTLARRLDRARPRRAWSRAREVADSHRFGGDP